jgi:glycosyltransferase involved in cell wall biosynthesis
MNLLHAVNGYPPYDTGGPEALASEMNRKLTEHGLEIHVLTLGPYSENIRIKKGLYIHRVKHSRKRCFGPFQPFINSIEESILLRKTAKVLMENHDLSIIHSTDFAGYYIVGKLPTIYYHMHPTWYDFIFTNSLQQKFNIITITLHMERRIAKRADIILCDSYFAKCLFDRFYPFAKDKTTVLHLGVDTNRFKPMSGYALRKLFGLHENDIMILHPGGGRSERKGTMFLLHALKKLSKYNWCCIITGSGREAGWNRRLTSELKNIGLKNVILTGEIRFEDLPKYYAAANIVVFPSIFEGHPLPPMEALSCEKALICTNISDHKLLFKDHEDSILIDPLNVDAIKNAIEELILDEALRKTIGRRGRKLIEQKLSLDITAERLVKTYESIGS